MNVLLLEILLITQALKFDLPLLLLLSICTVESGLDSKAINLSDPSYGLCQIKTTTASWIMKKDISAEDLMDATLNAEVAATYVKHLSKRYPNDIDSVISAFNAGTATGKNRPYVLKVKSIMRKYYARGYVWL